jgi:hypothetical protein
VPHERLHERGAAVDRDVLAFLPLQVGDLFHDIVLDQRRVVPFQGLFEGLGDHVFAHVVEVIRPFGLALRPGCREPLVGHASQQQGIAGGGLFSFELRDLVVPVLERPPWLFHDAI